MLTCFLSYANQYTKPFNEISGVVTELQNAIACAARLLELIDAPAQVPEKENAVALRNTEGYVDCDHVAFSYVPDQKADRGFQFARKAGSARGDRWTDGLRKDHADQSSDAVL